MSRTGSSSQSECSANTLSPDMNSDNLVNFQQRFNIFNPEAQTPHSFDTSSVGGKSLHSDTNICDQNYNSLQNYKYEPICDPTLHSTRKAMSCNGPYPELRPHCSCNIHIHYNISYRPYSATGQCQCSSKIAGFNTDFLHGDHMQPICKGNNLVCDV